MGARQALAPNLASAHGPSRVTWSGSYPTQRRRGPAMGSLWYAVVVDAQDPARLSRWWAEVLGYRILDEDENDVVVGQAEKVYPILYFSRTTAEKSGKNRLHIDLSPVDREAEVERLVN